MILVYVVIGWLSGLVLSTWKPGFGTWWFLFAAAGLLTAVLMRQQPNWRIPALCVLAAGLGMWRYSTAQPSAMPTPSELTAYNDHGFAEITGVISEMPDVRDNDIHLDVDVTTITQDKHQHTITQGTALVLADRFGTYAYGDTVRIQGEPTTPPSFDTFSYRDYLARTGVYTFLPYAKVQVLSHGGGNPVRAALLDIRERSHQLINQLLPSPQSSLLTGILLGIDTDLSPEISNAFIQTGTSHIIAISGMNITIVAGLLFAIFGRLSDKRIAAILMLCGIGAYTIFVGASPSVVRAAIMAALAIMAQRFGRRSDGLTALALSVGIMTLLNPDLWLDMGLVLSAMATLGLILFTGPLTKLAERLIIRIFPAENAQRVVEIVSELVLVTLAAQITTLPIIFLVFGQFSVVSFLVNVLVIPAQGSIMSLGILAVVAGAIWFPAGQITAWLVGIPLSYTLSIIRSMAQVPGASIPVAPDPALIAMYYVLLFGAVGLYSQPPERRQMLLARLRTTVTVPALATLGAAIAVILWAVVLSRPDGKLHVWFLAVGQGNAVLIQSPQGAHILIDGGENPTELRTAVGDHLPFYQRDLDLLVITEPKSSAIGALPALFDRYTVKTAITNGQTATDSSYLALQNALSTSKTKRVTVMAGSRIQTDDGLTLEVVYPPETPASPDPADLTSTAINPGDSAMVLRLSYGKSSFLLSPALTEKGVQAVLASGHDLTATVLELPANGGDKENPSEWIKAVQPQFAVVEAEQGNPAAQPDSVVFQRLGAIPLCRTDLQGTVEMITDGSQFWITGAQHSADLSVRGCVP